MGTLLKFADIDPLSISTCDKAGFLYEIQEQIRPEFPVSDFTLRGLKIQGAALHEFFEKGLVAVESESGMTVNLGVQLPISMMRLRIFQYPLEGTLVITTLQNKKWRKTILHQ